MKHWMYLLYFISFIILCAADLQTIEIIPDGGFEGPNALNRWTAIFGCSQISIDNNSWRVHSGNGCLLDDYRTNTFCGVGVEVFGLVFPGETVTFSGWVRVEGDGQSIYMTVQQNTASGETNYPHFTTIYPQRDVYNFYQAVYTIPNDTVAPLTFYFEGPAAGSNIVLDDVSMTVVRNVISTTGTTGIPTTGLPTTGAYTTGIPTTGIPTTGYFQPTTGAPSLPSNFGKIQYPLFTQSRWIVDQRNSRVKLACVNWYGAEGKDFVVGGLNKVPLDFISSQIADLGYNCVRLPWSNEMYERNPVINATFLEANPDYIGKKALTIFDHVVNSLSKYRINVILDNHMSDGDWCCSGDDGNGLWYNTRYSEQQWINDWVGMVQRYIGHTFVIGTDLRNELRQSCDWGYCKTPQWGGSDPTVDWYRAAQTCGNAILAQNPNLLIIVEGLNYATDLTGAYSMPMVFNVPNRLVYSAHDYSFFHDAGISETDLFATLGNNWGYLLTQNQPYTAPVWVSEFGTCHTDPSCFTGWFSSFRYYLDNADIDWSYWALDGTETSGTSRVFGTEETYGILNVAWNGTASIDLTALLQSIIPKSQGPNYCLCY